MKKSQQERITALEYRVEQLERQLEKMNEPAFNPGDRLRERVRHWERLVAATESCLADPKYRVGGLDAVPGWQQDLRIRQGRLDKARAKLAAFEERQNRKGQRARYIANCLAAAP